MRCLRHARQRLPPHLRAVVTLRDVEGLDSGELGELLGIREATQQAWLQRARSRLKRALDKHLIQMWTLVRSKDATS
jgi:RNA polymerase sigma-70 factor, ECF subfamily